MKCNSTWRPKSVDLQHNMSELSKDFSSDRNQWWHFTSSSARRTEAWRWFEKIHHNWRWQLWHGDALGVVSLSKGCLVLRAPRYIGSLLMPGSLGCRGESSFLSQRIRYDTDVLWGVNDGSPRPSGLWYRMLIRLVCLCLLVRAYVMDVNLHETKISTWQNIKILVDIEYLDTSIWWKYILNAGFVFWNRHNIIGTACVYELQCATCSLSSYGYCRRLSVATSILVFYCLLFISYCLLFFTCQRQNPVGYFGRDHSHL